MDKDLTIIDKDYSKWVEDLSVRYRQSQIKTAVKVNREMLEFYWELGRDIVKLKAEKRWGDKFLSNLSMDLRRLMPDANTMRQLLPKLRSNLGKMYSVYRGDIINYSTILHCPVMW